MSDVYVAVWWIHSSLKFLFVSMFPLFSCTLTSFETQLLPLHKKYHVFLQLQLPWEPSSIFKFSKSCFCPCLCSLHILCSWPPLLHFLLFSECLKPPWDPPGHKRHSGGLQRQNKAVSSKDLSQAYFEMISKEGVNICRPSDFLWHWISLSETLPLLHFPWVIYFLFCF